VAPRVASFVRCRFPKAVPAVRATRCMRPVNTGIPRDSFRLSGPRSMSSTPKCRPQRLLTSCAHRLRKPHRPTRLLTPSVAGRCPTERSTLRRARLIGAPRDVNHARNPSCQALGFRCGGFRATRTECQDAFRWLDLRPRDRSRLARAPFNVCLRSPRTLFTHRESAPVVYGHRRVKLTLACSTSPKARRTRRGRCVYTNECNRLTPRAPPRSLDSRITSIPRFHRRWRLPRHPARPKPWRRA